MSCMLDKSFMRLVTPLLSFSLHRVAYKTLKLSLSRRQANQKHFFPALYAMLFPCGVCYTSDYILEFLTDVNRKRWPNNLLEVFNQTHFNIGHNCLKTHRYTTPTNLALHNYICIFFGGGGVTTTFWKL